MAKITGHVGVEKVTVILGYILTVTGPRDCSSVFFICISVTVFLSVLILICYRIIHHTLPKITPTKRRCKIRTVLHGESSPWYMKLLFLCKIILWLYAFISLYLFSHLLLPHILFILYPCLLCICKIVNGNHAKLHILTKSYNSFKS